MDGWRADADAEENKPLNVINLFFFSFFGLLVLFSSFLDGFEMSRMLHLL